MFPIIPANSVTASGNEGLFGFGNCPAGNCYYSLTNKVSNAGVVASDTTGVGTGRQSPAATEYGGDKGIFGFGHISSSPYRLSMTNKVSNAGVVASDTTGVGTPRSYPAACGYGGDKGIFGFGSAGGGTAVTNLVSNTGVVASDTAGAAGTTARHGPEGCEFGGGEAIFAFGEQSSSPYQLSITNLVSNTGVVASDTAGVSGVQARRYHGGCSFN